MASATSEDNSIVENFTKKVVDEGEKMFVDRLPVIIEQLTEIVDSSIMNLTPADIIGDMISSLPQNPVQKQEFYPENPCPTSPVSKKRKVTGKGPKANGNNSDASPAESLTIPCNARLAGVISSMKGCLEEAIRVVSKIKIWIQLLIPRIEDGNNFGVAVQEECVNETSRVEDHVFAVMEGLTKYYQTRAKLVSKALKYPTIKDFKQTLIECDEMEYVNLRISMVDVRNNYVVLYDLLHKNYEKIRKPRTSHRNDMML